MANCSSEEGPWATLISEALAEVFVRLPFEERLRTVPLVCKGWRRASFDPACWRNVDMEPWFKAKSEVDYGWEWECQEEMEYLVRLVVDRSHGQLRQLRTMLCTNDSVEYIAERCPLLTELSIADSFDVVDDAAIKLALSCPRLERLDLSDCYKVTGKALEMFGIHCPSLVSFSRNMLRSHEFTDVVLPMGDEEALVIATRMQKLEHLELKKSFSLTDFGLMHIATRCKKLESLNLACCSGVSPSALEKVTAVCPNLKSFTKPINPRMHVNQKFLWVLFD
ncbi:hypothetical protein MPTK1_5g21020 [Marchantia polymorpha subsp. ruderalis]|uniref:F-box domain-containing protein n=2 Tax=Marchantia polymorpha TaxID=3197 RepID=A0AAF6BKL5_MARPO|nr:hypothetical protein MARPO_0058s0083 [Marchantia polymorpha]BBN12549.1 hypothetical protein Mp_5g21020 [Marchantia polymorpha subsp. ruderalis]|eukprot:PTQ37307.1 hypothetical protein MARPO_0058s0083 [Marchantia polymorpha]